MTVALVYGRASSDPTDQRISVDRQIKLCTARAHDLWPDAETKVFLPAGKLAAIFAETGADKADKVITYCGGGIAATADAFVLALLGHDNVAVYGGSLGEWVKDPAAPMETGPQAR